MGHGHHRYFASQKDAADVIPLHRSCEDAQIAKPMAQMDAYWHALRGGRLVPDRSDVDPRGIEGALSFAFIAERIAPGHARVRIAGNHMADLMGMEVRGMPMSALFEPGARPKLQSAIRSVFEDPAICKMQLTAVARIGKPALSADLVLYPLRNDLGQVSRILGCLIADGEIGRAPRRFDIARSKRMVLRPKEAKSLTHSAPPDPQLVTMAAPKPDFETTGVPYLRVVADNS